MIPILIIIVLILLALGIKLMRTKKFRAKLGGGENHRRHHTGPPVDRAPLSGSPITLPAPFAPQLTSATITWPDSQVVLGPRIEGRGDVIAIIYFAARHSGQVMLSINCRSDVENVLHRILGDRITKGELADGCIARITDGPELYRDCVGDISARELLPFPWDNLVLAQWTRVNGAAAELSTSWRELLGAHVVGLKEFGRGDHGISANEVPGICQCYDCNYEVHCWRALYPGDDAAVVSAMNSLPWPLTTGTHPLINGSREETLRAHPGLIISASDACRRVVINGPTPAGPLAAEEYTSAELELIKPILAGNKIEFKLQFLPELGRLPYRRHTKRFVSRSHIGQRKLLLNEVLFLTEYGHHSHEVVYAGAAGGHHIPLLAELFPQHKFILWDPAKFAIRPAERIEINNDYFTNETAAKYKAPLFISDIRSGSEKLSFGEFEAEVRTNNNWQRAWVEIMGAPMSMLKFRIPFDQVGPYPYFAGDLYLQPWAPIDSAETRLITNGRSYVDYTLADYESRLHFYNNITREFQEYWHNIPLAKVDGLCYCHDCSYEIYIWSNYFTKNGLNGKKLAQWSPEMVEAIVNTMRRATKIIGRSLFVGAHGRLANMMMRDRRPLLKQMGDNMPADRRRID